MTYHTAPPKCHTRAPCRLQSIHSKGMNQDMLIEMANGRLEPGMQCLVTVISVAVEENYGGRGRETKDWHMHLTGREKPLTAHPDHCSSTTTREYPWKYFLYFPCHWETSPDRANQGLVQTAVIQQCSLLTPNWAWSPVGTWRQKPRNHRRAGTSRCPWSSLQPQGTDLLLSNPIHSSKEGMALIYSKYII